MTCKRNPLHTLFMDNYRKSCQLFTPFDFSHCTFFPQRLLPMPSIKQPKWTPTSRWKKSRYEWKITPVIPKKDSWQLLPYYHCLFFIFLLIHDKAYCESILQFHCGSFFLLLTQKLPKMFCRIFHICCPAI